MEVRSRATIDTDLLAVVDALAQEFRGVFSWATVANVVADTAMRWRQARIRQFVPTLTHRFASDRLRAIAQAEGWIDKPVPEVLFVCVRNAGRSQMAAALMNHYARGRVHVRSAGSAPALEIYGDVVQVMDEWGLDLTREFPKPLTDEAVRAADVVVTMGCGDACPIYEGKWYVDWDLTDPAGRDLEDVRAIRDEIDQHVLELLEEIERRRAAAGGATIVLPELDLSAAG